MAAIREAEVALVQAPTGLTGFLLVMRFPELRSRNVQDAEGRWIVRVPLSEAADVGTVIERVQAWMRQERIAETSVRIGADVYRVGVDHTDLETQTEGGE